jgi:two-component system, NtrC family, nitrogen regulation sensor histidine kinase NtrY
VPNGLTGQGPKGGSWALFEGLFIIAALVAVFATFIAIGGVDPDNPTAGATPWLLGLNGFVIIVLALVVVREYVMMRASGGGEGQGRLARRFVLLFSFSALVPAAIVAAFLGAVFTRGLDNWMGDRVDRVMTQNREVLQDYRDNFDAAFQTDVKLAAADVENFARAVELSMQGNDPDGAVAEKAASVFSEGLRSTLAYRGFLTIAIIGADGRDVIAEQSVQAPVLIEQLEADFDAARRGETVTKLYEARGLATSITKISKPVDGYVYAAKSFDRNLIGMLREAESQLVQYENAKRRSGRLQTIFAVGYTQIAALVLLLAARLGLEAAGRITTPIGRLAMAAHSVRDGDLSVRIPETGPKDELLALAHSFNAMTSQLSQQRGALIQAREEAEERRKFIETLLAEVGAGVIRMDRDHVITIANRSARELLGVAAIQPGQNLADIAPELDAYAADVFEQGIPVDASIDIERNGEILHMRIKAAPDPADGCVLTFDDTTRLVNDQRQLAWRDVARRIAHEIRNPLTPIMLSTERLKRRYADKIDDHDGVFARCIETILRQVGDIGRMVEEFSSFARMPKPSVAPFDIKKMLENIGFSQAVVSPEVTVEVSGDAPPDAYIGDERLLGQAFGNLLKNAAEAIHGMPEHIEVAGIIRVDLKQVSNGLEVIIEDDGPGFPAEMRDRLLEPYVTTREKGTGLGLAIVNRIIMDHGGTISLQNRLDGRRGARVRVWLPTGSAINPKSSPLTRLAQADTPPSALQPHKETAS